MAGFCHSVVVEEADQDRAIDMVIQMMRNLTRENPRRINNVSVSPLDSKYLIINNTDYFVTSLAAFEKVGSLNPIPC